MEAAEVPGPRTMIVHSENRDQVARQFGLPVVLKLPDSTFSRGVVKAKTPEELEERLDEILEGERPGHRTGIHAQRLRLAHRCAGREAAVRVQVLHGARPLADLQLGQRHQEGQEGDFATMPVAEAPAFIVEAALKAVHAIVGEHGLFGVDVKEFEGKPYVIEVNECPNIDHGVEDVALGDELYRAIIGSLKRSIEHKIGIQS
jgi:glutathione synthase/RimK-type ligase-like ATP-grasp enzyme